MSFNNFFQSIEIMASEAAAESRTRECQRTVSPAAARDSPEHKSGPARLPSLIAGQDEAGHPVKAVAYLEGDCTGRAVCSSQFSVPHFLEEEIRQISIEFSDACKG